MDNSKINFMQSAVNDVQATIRAIDVKIGALLVLVLAPFANIAKVFGHVDKLCCRSPKCFFIAVGIAFFMSWIMALASLVRALGATNNPAAHIPKTANVNGTYFGGGLYSFGIIDAFINRKKITANKDLTAFVASLPSNDDDVLRELAFEQMKVAYIRDIKANRLKWGLRFSVVWVAFGICIYLSSRYVPEIKETAKPACGVSRQTAAP